MGWVSRYLSHFLNVGSMDDGKKENMLRTFVTFRCHG